MLESEYSDLNPKDTTICKLQQKQLTSGDTQFWYADESEEEPANTTSCTGTKITGKLTELGGQVIARGKFLADKAELTTIDKDTITENAEGEVTAEGALENRVINTKAGHTTKYYYLVVKYPNNGDQTEGDAGKQITAKLTLDGKPASTLYTES